jgi:ferritin-like protein
MLFALLACVTSDNQTWKKEYDFTYNEDERRYELGQHLLPKR